jgi:hypothetical protein
VEHVWSKQFIAKAIPLFLNMDKMIGGQFERGLASMKSVVEAVCPDSRQRPCTLLQSQLLLQKTFTTTLQWAARTRVEDDSFFPLRNFKGAS